MGEGSPRRDAAQDRTAACLAQSGPTFFYDVTAISFQLFRDRKCSCCSALEENWRYV